MQCGGGLVGPPPASQFFFGTLIRKRSRHDAAAGMILTGLRRRLLCQHNMRSHFLREFE